MNAERERIQGFGRLEDGLHQAGDWYIWGPYLTERQWGTVREDYSADGAAWDYFPHDHARSRAYRWGEDGLAGFCDIEQRLCLGLALWNGRDPILKERAFGLTGPQGNHGEDVKEHWWYLDALPSHAWNRWRYHYPQGPFPYDDLVTANAARNRFQPEYELLDTGAFDGDRYWIVEVSYAKAGPGDVLMTVRVKNAGPDAETLHVLPAAWFRNTWSWDAGAPKPVLEAAGDPAAPAVRIEHPFLGELELLAGDGPDGTSPTLLFCENETNLARLYRVPPTTAYPKDGINDHVVSGAATVNPDQRGTKCSIWYQLTVEPGATAELRLRLRPRAARPGSSGPLADTFVRINDQRQAEADEFYASLTPAGASEDEARVMRQAFAGLLWSKQFYYFDVTRWLEGDPAQPPPPPGRQLGPIDRSHLPAGGKLEQSDATGWMAFYAVSMASMATVLYRSGRRPADDITLKFLEHFADIADAINTQGMWDDGDGLYYDKLLTADGTEIPVKTRSMVGVIPVLAAAIVDQRMLDDSLRLGKQFADFLRRQGIDDPAKLTATGLMRGEPGDRRMLLSLVGLDHLEKLAARLFDESEFLSPYGLRALSAYHRDHPYVLDVEGQMSTIDYEPAESTTAMFGGNSNWRGPLWFPLNFLLIDVLGRYHRFFGDGLTLEYPAGSGHRVPLNVITADLQDRLISIFLVGPDGRRPCFGWVERLQQDPEWKDNIVFSEYFHGDNAAGLGASHQTGWTGVIADVIRRRHGAVPSIDDVVAALDQGNGAPEPRP
jgi:hypothetical protein